MDKVLKQRLVGASILIALAVIFLPMLFDGGDPADDGQRRMAVDVPERDSGERRVRRLALDPESARQPPDDTQAEAPPARPEPSIRQAPEPVESDSRDLTAEEPVADRQDDGGAPPESAASAESDAAGEGSVAEESTAGREAPARPEETAPEQAVVAQPETKDAPPEPADAADSIPVAGNWVVQVAVFGSRETAGSIRQRLVELGHRVSMDVLIRDQAELFRLRTGPYGDEPAAEAARGQIAATVAGVQPVVRELSGDGSAEERSGLVVQVGSFASNSNAERLVGQLSAAGFDAFMYGEESGGRTIWRVRVGAFDNRPAAETLLETLREEQGLDGIVVSHP